MCKPPPVNVPLVSSPVGLEISTVTLSPALFAHERGPLMLTFSPSARLPLRGVPSGLLIIWQNADADACGAKQASPTTPGISALRSHPDPDRFLAFPNRKSHQKG